MKKLKILIEVDMEGSSGVTQFIQVVPGQAEWEKAREYLTEDVNAAVKGIFIAAKEKNISEEKVEINIVDAHWANANILLDRLDKRVNKVYRGIERKYPQLESIDENYHGVIAIANHDQSFVSDKDRVGLLSHTWLPGWRWIINGDEVSETIINAYTAGEFNVPIILVSGDDVFIEKVKIFYNSKGNEIEGVIVKEAYGLQSGAVKSLTQTREDIVSGSYRAIIKLIEGQYTPLICQNLTELRIILPEKIDFNILSKVEKISIILEDRLVLIKRRSYKEAILKGAEILNLYYPQMLIELEKNVTHLRYEFILL